MNLCQDCIHFHPGRGRFSGPSCGHPSALAPTDPLYGFRERGNPRELRGSGGLCGPMGDLFAPKDPPKPVSAPKRWWQR